MVMMLLKVSSASESTMVDSAGRVHPLFITDPAVRHTFVLPKILIGGFDESGVTQDSVVVS